MKLFVSQETFIEMLPKLVASGCTFDAEEKNGGIAIEFTGGY